MAGRERDSMKCFLQSWVQLLGEQESAEHNRPGVGASLGQRVLPDPTSWASRRGWYCDPPPLSPILQRIAEVCSSNEPCLQWYRAVATARSLRQSAPVSGPGAEAAQGSFEWGSQAIMDAPLLTQLRTRSVFGCRFE